jgi:hypothetical protein
LKEVGPIDVETGSAKEVALPVEAGSDRGLGFVAFLRDDKSGHVLAVAQQTLQTNVESRFWVTAVYLSIQQTTFINTMSIDIGGRVALQPKPTGSGGVPFPR